MPKNLHRLVAVAGVLSLLVSLGGCADDADDGGAAQSTTETTSDNDGTSSSMTTSAPVASTTASGNSVDIVEFVFVPARLEVKVGAEVSFRNTDETNHTATADDSSFDSQPIAIRSSFKHTFDKAGTFTYHCAIHNSMKGTITVS